ncbi:MAG: serine--tRNA ligase [Candidatus Paceibacterota bacterium]
MLDIKFIKDNQGIVAKAITDKNREPVDLEQVIKLYDWRKRLRSDIDQLNRRRAEAAAARNIDLGRQCKEEAADKEEELRRIEKEFMALMVQIPNIPSPDTPIGPDESANQVIRTVGDKPTFDFSPKAHWDLGRELGLIDSEKGAMVAGSRFTYLKGDLVLLQFALIQLALGVLTNRDKIEAIAATANLDISTRPFVPVIPPAMLTGPVLNRMARLEPKDDKYYIEKDELFLAGSAEHTVGALHMDEILELEKLPLRYLGYSTAFRREAGSYGKDTKGILRMHQFDKLEMQSFTSPENGLAEQDLMVAIQEHLMQALELPYQVVMVCTGDMGFPDQRQIDIETWMPGQDTYRETHSADFIGSFQPRRLNTKVRQQSGRPEYVHMNDATAFAIGRTLIAIMENYQQADGTIAIPKVLQPLVGKDIISAR